MKFHLDQCNGQPVLRPFDEAAITFLTSQIDAEPIELEHLHYRDMVKHRAIMAQIGDLAKALHKSPEMMRAELLYATGNFTLVGALVGLPVVIAVNSMSRASMRDHELDLFWNEARDVIETRLLQRIEDSVERARLSQVFSPQPA